MTVPVTTIVPVTPAVPETPPVKKELPRIIEHENKLFDFIDIAGFRGYVPSKAPKPEFPKLEPYMEWTGGRISLAEWQKILAFFEWTQAEFKSEAQVRLYYHDTEHRWRAWAYPQTPSGMTTNEIGGHPDYKVQRSREFPPPWCLLGTVHHHCTMGAFQSSVDKNDEESYEGIHLTVGGISSPEYSLHARASVKNAQFTVTERLFEWFEPPSWLRDVPAHERKAMYKLFQDAKVSPTQHMLKQPPPDGTTFPEEWKTNCHRPAHTVGFKGGTGGHESWRSGEYDYHSGTRIQGQSGNTSSSDSSELFDQFTIAELKFMDGALAIYEKAGLAHTVADELVYAAVSGTNKTPGPVILDILSLAKDFNIDGATVDRLFDMWDFDIVLRELTSQKRWPVTETAPAKTMADFAAAEMGA